MNNSLRFGFGLMIAASLSAFVGCGGEQAPSSVDQELYDDVVSTTSSSDLNSSTQCVYNHGYWERHNKYAADPTKAIAWPRDPWVPNKDSEDKLLCGQTLHSILTTPWNGTNWHALAQAWIPAYLNVKNGAAASPTVTSAFQNAFFSLMNCGEPAGDPSKAQAFTLKAWNAGNSGPAACPL